MEDEGLATVLQYPALAADAILDNALQRRVQQDAAHPQQRQPGQQRTTWRRIEATRPIRMTGSTSNTPASR